MINKYARVSSKVTRNVYRRHFGEIPSGMVVHHRDMNPLNTSPLNLKLISVAEHNAIHRQRGYNVSGKQKAREQEFGQIFL